MIRLRPKADARAIRHGAPWAFEGEIVTDRRTRRSRPARSRCWRMRAARRWGWWRSIRNQGSWRGCSTATRARGSTPRGSPRGWSGRSRCARGSYEAPFYRLVHAEADGLPGVVIDRFGEIAVIQPNAAWAEGLLPALSEAVQAVTGVTTVLKNASGRARALEGLDAESAVLAGAAPDGPVPVPMNGATCMADLTGGQKTGIFYDQRPNHAFAARLARGARVLDVFSHVGGFSLAALTAGAARALAVDSSRPALDLAVAGAARSGVAERFETRRGDAFAVMEALAGEGARFDLVICDPPAFAPSKPALEKGLRAYERVARLAAALVEPGGYLGLCSCSHAADLGRFRAACTRGIGRAGRCGALIHTGLAGPDHPLHPRLAESGYLKALFYRL